MRATRARLGASAPETFRAIGNLGYFYKQGRQPGKAVALLETAATGLADALGESDREVLYLRGYLAGAYMELRRYDDALPILLELVRRFPAAGIHGIESQVARYNLGCVYANLGNHSEALRWIRDSQFSPPPNMRMDPHTKPLHGIKEFEDLSREAWVGHSVRATHMFEWAKMATARGDIGGAERAFLQLLDRAPNHVAAKHELLRQLGDLYLSEHRFVEAEARFRQSRELLAQKVGLHPSAVATLHWYVAQSLLGQGRSDEARREIDEMLAYDDGTRTGAEFHYAHAMRLALVGKGTSAIAELEQLAEKPFDRYDWLRRDLAFDALRDDRRFKELHATIIDRSRF